MYHIGHYLGHRVNWPSSIVASREVVAYEALCEHWSINIVGQTTADPSGLGPCKLGEMTNYLRRLLGGKALDLWYSGVIDLIMEISVTHLIYFPSIIIFKNIPHHTTSWSCTPVPFLKNIPSWRSWLHFAQHQCSGYWPPVAQIYHHGPSCIGQPPCLKLRSGTTCRQYQNISYVWAPAARSSSHTRLGTDVEAFGRCVWPWYTCILRLLW